MGCKPIALPLRWFESNPAHGTASLSLAHFPGSLRSRCEFGRLRQGSVACAAPHRSARRRSRASSRRDGFASRAQRVHCSHIIFCMSTTSSQRLNLRPTSCSRPTCSKPQAACRAIEASWPPTMRADHRVEAVVAGQLDEVRRAGAGRRPDPAGRAARRPSPRRSWSTRAGGDTASATRTPRPRPRRRPRRWPDGRPSARRSRPAARPASGAGDRTSPSTRAPRRCRSRAARRRHAARRGGSGRWRASTRPRRYATRSGNRACSAKLVGLRPLSSVGRALPW